MASKTWRDIIYATNNTSEDVWNGRNYQPGAHQPALFIEPAKATYFRLVYHFYCNGDPSFRFIFDPSDKSVWPSGEEQGVDSDIRSQMIAVFLTCFTR